MSTQAGLRAPQDRTAQPDPPALVPETTPVPGSRPAVPGGEMPVPVPGHHRVPGSGGSPHDSSAPGGSRLSGLQKCALAATIILALALFVYAAAGSYQSVSGLAATHHVPLPGWVPLGIDGSLILALLADIVLTWIGHPIWWLRAATRGFVAGSVAANAAAGWPDPVAVFLHCFAPIIVLLVTEAGRIPMLRSHRAVRRRKRAEDGHDPIPLARWLAAPASTLVMWRRMALWGVRSYTQAVTAEVTRRKAIVQLRVHYGRRWRKHAPGDLVWLLRTGNRLEEACARVAAITEPEAGTAGNHGTGTSRDKKPGTGNRNRRTRNSRHGGNRRGPAGNRNAGTGTGNQDADEATDPVLLADVRRRIAEHRQKHGRELTVDELRAAIHTRKSVAARALRDARKAGPDAQGAKAQP